MTNTDKKTKKKTLTIGNNTKKKTPKQSVNKDIILENAKNPVYKKYLIEFQTFFKEKKKNDKSKKKDKKFEYLENKLVKTTPKGKKVIKLPDYIILDSYLNNTEKEMDQMNKKICYIRNIIDFCKEEDIPEDIISRYDELNKEYRKLDNEKKIYEECIFDINKVYHKSDEEKAEKESEINLQERKVRDLYFIIKEKKILGEDISQILKEYIEEKKIYQNKKMEDKIIDDSVNYLIKELPVIEK